MELKKNEMEKTRSNVRHSKMMTLDSIGMILCTLILFAFKKQLYFVDKTEQKISANPLQNNYY